MSDDKTIRIESDGVGHGTRIFVGDVDLGEILPIKAARHSWHANQLNRLEIDVNYAPLTAKDRADALDLPHIMRQLVDALGYDKVKAALVLATGEM